MRGTALLVVTLALAGCSQDASETTASGEPELVEAAAPTAARVAPYEGPVTVARLERAKGEVKPFMPWDAALNKLHATVGSPHLVDGAKFYWYVLDARTCHELFVENAAGEVGAVSFGAYDEIMKKQWDRCQQSAPAATAAGPPAGADPTADPAPGGEGDEVGW